MMDKLNRQLLLSFSLSAAVVLASTPALANGSAESNAGGGDTGQVVAADNAAEISAESNAGAERQRERVGLVDVRLGAAGPPHAEGHRRQGSPSLSA